MEYENSKSIKIKIKKLGQVWVDQNLTQHNLPCLESGLDKKTNIMIIYLVLF